MLLHLMPKPTIAMIGGPAVGAGCSLAAACDLRFASDDAVISAGFVPNGLSGDYGGTFLRTRIVGTAEARRLYLLNEKLAAPKALARGLVHEVVPAPALHTRVREVAATLARTPAALLGLVKDNLNQAEDDLDRRRFLFAKEAENQIQGARLMFERMQARPPAADRP
jgi:2-(1,2-epoxy-1,2-dihydrophenyl)acetyl-CoA isomerase